MPEEPDDDSEGLERPPSFFPYDDEVAPREYVDLGEPVEVQIEGVFAAETGGQIQRFVLLTDGDRKLPILIGPFEAQAISLPLDGTTPDRPMTHDLIRNMLERLDATIDRIVIDDLWSTTFYAKIYLRTGGEEIELDSRPSDAIALAVRFEAPIFVADGILSQSSES